MPNTVPAVLTLERLEIKFKIAAQRSLANYSFFMGVCRDNWQEALRTDPSSVCGLSDDGLYLNDKEATLSNDPEIMYFLFSRCHTLVALHCEDHSVISRNIRKWGMGCEINPCKLLAMLRSEQACIEATQKVLSAAQKHSNRVHLLHISTLAEARLMDARKSVREKRITAEACLPHLYFSDQDYPTLGNSIKWNSSVKTMMDKKGLLDALLSGHLDIIATDHAPHLFIEKQGSYLKAKSGGPLVQQPY
ncbi:amidohydrolase family protein [Pedobacter jamesrossensis]